MKGVVFTEFLDFVSATHGADMVDDIIDDADLPHGGSYTTVGTYPFQEMQRLVTALCCRGNLRADALLHSFGIHLCRHLSTSYHSFFTASPNLFDFLDSVDRHIHAEVLKLYADAELPKFRTVWRDEDRILLDYASCRPLASLAEGMIEAAAQYFGESVTISQTRVAGESEPVTRFAIERAA